MKRTALASLVAVALLAVQVSWAQPTFTTSLVEDAQLTGEPGIAVDPATDPATVYVVAPEASSQLWRSDDGGLTFARVAATAGGSGDSDVAVDAAGVVYVSDLLDASLNSTMPVSTSFDRGATFARIRDVVPGGAGWDRQWLAAGDAGHVVATGRNVNLYAAWVSRDAADTFSGPFTIAADATKGGQPLFAPDGSVYAPYTTSTQVRIARSLDGGETWTTAPVAPLDGSPLIFPVAEVDDAGNVYVVWADGFRLQVATLDGKVSISASTDAGSTWSAPTVLSDTARTAIFPWIVAGAAGKVDVAFYAARYTTVPDLGAELGGPYSEWDIEVAQSLDATAPSPTWTRTVAIEGFHTGSICTTGLTCPGIQQTGLGPFPTPFDRRHLDFFEIDIDPDGNALIVFGKDREFAQEFVGDLILSWIDVMLARQTGGAPLR